MRKFLGIIEDYRGLSRVLRYFWGIRLWCEDSSGFLDILAGFLDATQRFLGIIEDYRRFLRTIEGFLGFFWGEPRRILSREPRTLQDSSYFRWIFGHLEDSRPFQGILGFLKCGIFQDAPQVPRPFQGNLKRSSWIFEDPRGSFRTLPYFLGILAGFLAIIQGFIRILQASKDFQGSSTGDLSDPWGIFVGSLQDSYTPISRDSRSGWNHGTILKDATNNWASITSTTRRLTHSIKRQISNS